MKDLQELIKENPKSEEIKKDISECLKKIIERKKQEQKQAEDDKQKQQQAKVEEVKKKQPETPKMEEIKVKEG